ncbi:MAG: hypothetical protein ABIR57_08695 [Aeromicrobium sp.]
MAGQLRQRWTHSLWARIEKLLADPSLTLLIPGEIPRERAIHPRRTGRPRLSPALVDVLVADYQSGLSAGAVGRKNQVDDQTVLRHLAKRGIKTRKQKIGIPTDELANAKALRDAGWTFNAIAEKYGCSNSAVMKALRRHALAQTT